MYNDDDDEDDDRTSGRGLEFSLQWTSSSDVKMVDDVQMPLLVIFVLFDSLVFVVVVVVFVEHVIVLVTVR